MEEWLEERAMVTAVTSDPQEPKTFREAWDHDDPEQRMKWREAIRKEIRLMIEKGVWRFVKRKEISKSRRLVGSKWVFKIKRDGTFRARLVALGYSQMPGVDFSDNFAPVVNDVTFRIVLTRKLVEKLAALSIDVETAFLYGELEEEIYMTVPDGYAEVTEEEIDGAVYCCALLKSIYGLVQAARQFWKKFVSELKKLGFKASEADPCLLFRRDEKGICILIMYVDDMLSVGNRASLESLKESLAEIFNIKTEVDLADYLGCKFIISDDGERGWLRQPHITDGLEKKFGEKVKDTFFGKTPGTPGSVVVRPKDKEDCISEEEQQEFRSGVGTLLYLTKHSRPDICNATRELSKVMDGAAKAHQKELYRVIKHVLMTKALGLKFDPKREEGIWSLKAYSDSDFASDKDTRISVSGYVIYFLGVPVAWRSRGMRSVVLSTTEAEYISVSEVVKELQFIIQALESMDIRVKLPIVVHVDNVGAIWLANNQTTGDRTKHIDVRAHYVREFLVDGKILIEFVKSTNNDSDIFTKNL
ncbi:hypothetical protein ACA910_003579 [Epithemia clementina (nom. ined.)]